ncbi:hypothetical protein BDZ89DRAFT_1203616, partial [Hymenopellis radicata]
SIFVESEGWAVRPLTLLAVNDLLFVRGKALVGGLILWAVLETDSNSSRVGNRLRCESCFEERDRDDAPQNIPVPTSLAYLPYLVPAACRWDMVFFLNWETIVKFFPGFTVASLEGLQCAGCLKTKWSRFAKVEDDLPNWAGRLLGATQVLCQQPRRTLAKRKTPVKRTTRTKRMTREEDANARRGRTHEGRIAPPRRHHHPKTDDTMIYTQEHDPTPNSIVGRTPPHPTTPTSTYRQHDEPRINEQNALIDDKCAACEAVEYATGRYPGVVMHSVVASADGDDRKTPIPAAGILPRLSRKMPAYPNVDSRSSSTPDPDTSYTFGVPNPTTLRVFAPVPRPDEARQRRYSQAEQAL